jgi:Predicted oxidoreductases (related to aryl-alcohol dehydrogenases)
VGRSYGKTRVQVAITWVLSQSGIICALTGPSTITHLGENIGGSGWHLSSESCEELELFFKQEDVWLEQEQRASIRKILSESLPQESSRAFADLVYVIETATLLGLTSEKEVLSTFQELWRMRKTLNKTAGPKLESIRKRLHDMCIYIYNPNGKRRAALIDSMIFQT